ncbi:MAG: N-acetylmuramoyl-L-alanine amidase [Metallibacterium scheffleri]|jgi:N-acetylmuramoyl-L-alanine amidase|uniref:N-acetylmuramoyl-L-alanine amidase n=1 Tax=Metallibacterium scheffleri TaxID=993689 RepID=UPI0026E95FF7|nr:N-acetylmuramoyl-L-alanine amidase [Metallibacterium scheffleri]MCK9367198.1 N-acetylmuramoyl-L-alanine amidase [Metallibacterium scheffleri]
MSDVIHWPLPYVEALAPRALTDIDLIVLHCTELPDLASAREYGERVLYASGAGNSGHYYIDRDGRSYGFVPDARVAHHVRGHNEHSIGIELVNRGRWPHWLDSRHQDMAEAYSEAQIDALRTLLLDLHAHLPNLRAIAGHEDLDRERVPASDDAQLSVWRKRDPGPRFPWDWALHDLPLQRLHPATTQD